MPKFFVLIEKLVPAWALVTVGAASAADAMRQAVYDDDGVLYTDTVPEGKFSLSCPLPEVEDISYETVPEPIAAVPADE